MSIAVRHLRVFAVLLEEPSLRRAAAQLGVGQPALSRQIARIERLFGVDLIRRSADGVELTEAGHLVARYAVRLNDALDNLLDELSDVTSQPKPTLRVVASLNPVVTKAFLTDRGYSVRVARASDAAAAILIERGEADIALVVEQPGAAYPLSPSVRSAVILETPLWAALPAGHDLVRQDTVRMVELATEPWLLHAKGALRALTAQTWARAGFHPAVTLEDEVEALLPAVERGAGVTLASPLCGVFYGNRLVMRPVTGTPCERKVCLWRPDTVSTELVRAIVAEHQRRHLALAPRLPQYFDWLQTAPAALPKFTPR